MIYIIENISRPFLTIFVFPVFSHNSSYALTLFDHLSMLTWFTYKICFKSLHTRTSNWPILTLKHIQVSAQKYQYFGRNLNSKKRVTFKVPYCTFIYNVEDIPKSMQSNKWRITQQIRGLLDRTSKLFVLEAYSRQKFSYSNLLNKPSCLENCRVGICYALRLTFS